MASLKLSAVRFFVVVPLHTITPVLHLHLLRPFPSPIPPCPLFHPVPPVFTSCQPHHPFWMGLCWEDLSSSFTFLSVAPFAASIKAEILNLRRLARTQKRAGAWRRTKRNVTRRLKARHTFASFVCSSWRRAPCLINRLLKCSMRPGHKLSHKSLLLVAPFTFFTE